MDKVEKESSDITVGKCLHHFYFCNNFVKPPCIFIFFRHADTEVILQQSCDNIAHLS